MSKWPFFCTCCIIYYFKTIDYLTFCVEWFSPRTMSNFAAAYLITSPLAALYTSEPFGGGSDGGNVKA